VVSQSIDDLKIDLVVLGNKGKTGAKELFMGSNTIAVANSIENSPILAIPREINYAPLLEIAFVTDFKKGCTRKTLAPLISIASISKTAINVLHINEEDIMSSNQVSNKKLLKINLADVPHSLHDELEYADKANVIQNYVSKNNITMLAMAYHRKKFFARLLHEPIVKDISIYAKTPFLILPIQD
jgi:nucleotide-binding universal stress UspA family protein